MQEATLVVSEEGGRRGGEGEEREEREERGERWRREGREGRGRGEGGERCGEGALPDVLVPTESDDVEPLEL